MIILQGIPYRSRKPYWAVSRNGRRTVLSYDKIIRKVAANGVITIEDVKGKGYDEKRQICHDQGFPFELLKAIETIVPEEYKDSVLAKLKADDDRYAQG